MDSGTLMQFLVIWMAFMAMLVPSAGRNCSFEAIFTFGDSNSDTGGFFAAFPAQPPPNGMTYFKKPTGRQSDGRLYIDFLAQALGLPFLNPYLQSIESDFRNGVNFATSASTALPSNLFVNFVSPFSLGVQLQQMKQFKARVDEKPSGGTTLPPSNVFGKSLYFIYIGQNDFTSNLSSHGIAGVKQYLPQVLSQISSTIKELYWLGARTFLVLNLAPIGCYPAYLVELPHNSSDIDQYGCLISYNEAVNDYNDMLKEVLRQTRHDLPDAQLIYVNSHDVLLEIFQHPASHGLKYTTKACCGYGGSPYNFSPEVWCAYSKWINGKKITATGCGEPQNYLIWDGIHTTEAANKILANAILKGSYFDPPFSLHQYCDLQPID